MAVELRVPQVGESISEVQIGEWLKRPGDEVRRDETLVVIETEKATVELPAPRAGILSEILKKAGEMAVVGEIIGYLQEVEAAETVLDAAAAAPSAPETRVMPAAQRVLAEHEISAGEVRATGPGGRLLKEDVLRHLDHPPAVPAPELLPEPTTAVEPPPSESREEEIVAMSLLRRRIAERMVRAQQTAALLTTFNEIDMTAVIALREKYREPFQEKYKARLGFMSFFVKASVDALRLVPQVNAEVRDNHIVFRNYCDIGIAVGGGKGLVVPILRNAERMSFAEIEVAIEDFARRAKENRMNLEELQGGTFTISNGGIYGSLMSTPIVNPPQSGVLGLHAIQKRPVVIADQIVIRPMMYIALTYDHRIIDGREAVTFLRRIKETIEEPSRMLLEI